MGHVKLGSKIVEFREGFKPKSLAEFSRVYGAITGASKKELKKVYNELNGDSGSAAKDSGEAGE